MLPETSNTDPEGPERDPNPNLAAVQDDDDDFPFRFGFPPRPGPPPASALGSQIGPDRRQYSAPAPLLKHNSWSPDSLREETWQRRKDLHRRRRKDGGARMCRSVTEEDLEELRGCIDLGFGFEEEDEEGDQRQQDEVQGGGGGGTPKSNCSSGSANKKLWELLPALDLYYAVRRSSKNLPLPPPSPSASSLPAAATGTAAGLMSSSSSSSPGSSPLSLYSPGDSPREVKARLKQWAQIVACSVRQQGY